MSSLRYHKPSAARGQWRFPPGLRRGENHVREWPVGALNWSSITSALVTWKTPDNPCPFAEFEAPQASRLIRPPRCWRRPPNCWVKSCGANQIESFEEIVSAIFTTTADLTSIFPAEAARAMGMHQVPLLCACEIAVAKSMSRCIRVLLHVNTEKSQREIVHVYLREADGCVQTSKAHSKRKRGKSEPPPSVFHFKRRRLSLKEAAAFPPTRPWSYPADRDRGDPCRACLAVLPVDLRVETRLLQLLERHPQLFDLVGNRVEGIGPEFLGKNGLQPVVVGFDEGQVFGRTWTADGPGRYA